MSQHRLYRRRDVVTAALIAITFQFLVPFKWLAPEVPLGDMPHSALFGLPFPCMWWGMSSSLEYVLSPVPALANTLLWTSLGVAIIGLARSVVRPRFELTRLSLGVLLAVLLFPSLPLVILVVRLTLDVWPVDATPHGFQWGLSYQ